MERAGQVDGDDGVPFLDREVFHIGHVLDAGVVHQDVHPAKLRGGELHHVFDLGGLAHVRPVVGHLDAQGCDFGLGAIHVAKTVEHDVGTLAGQGLGDAQPDAAGGAGDEGGFSLKHFSISR
jgi:hypothetical protein